MTFLEAEAVAAVFVGRNIPARTYKLTHKYGFGVVVRHTHGPVVKLTTAPTPEEVERIIALGTHGAADEADPDREILRPADGTGVAPLPLPGRGGGLPTDQ